MPEIKPHTDKNGKVRHIPVRYNVKGERSETISISLPESRVARIRQIAKEHGHSKSKVVNDRLDLN